MKKQTPSFWRTAALVGLTIITAYNLVKGWGGSFVAFWLVALAYCLWALYRLWNPKRKESS